MAEAYKPSRQGFGNVIVSGPPASGKGTLCERMAGRYKLVHISTGDLLRSRRRDMPELAAFLDAGGLAPDELVCGVVAERLAEPDCVAFGVVLDGFPRTAAQARALSALGVQIAHFVLLDVPDELVTERVEGRRIDPVSGRIYHTRYRPAESAAVAARLMQRPDDTRERIGARLRAYHANMAPILEHYATVRRDIVLGAGCWARGGPAAVAAATTAGTDAMTDAAAAARAAQAAVAGSAAGDTLFDWARHLLPAGATPEMVFDRLRMVLEGACSKTCSLWLRRHLTLTPLTAVPFSFFVCVAAGDGYWGALIEAGVRVRSADARGAAMSGGALAVARYFEHSEWLMLNNGALKDAARAVEVRGCVVTAQAMELSGVPLLPTLLLRSRVWIEAVGGEAAGGAHAIVLGHRLLTTRRELRRATELASRRGRWRSSFNAAAARATATNSADADAARAAYSGSDEGEDGDEQVEIARGLATLTLLGPAADGVDTHDGLAPVPVPFARVLAKLVRPRAGRVLGGTALRRYVAATAAAAAAAAATTAGSRSDGGRAGSRDSGSSSSLRSVPSWSQVLHVSPHDVDGPFAPLRPASLLQLAETARFEAVVAAAAAAPSGHNWAAWRAKQVRVQMLQRVRLGDRVRVNARVQQPELAQLRVLVDLWLLPHGNSTEILAFRCTYRMAPPLEMDAMHTTRTKNEESAGAAGVDNDTVSGVGARRAKL